MKTRWLAVVAVSALMASGCGDDAPTTPTQVTSPVTSTFTSRLTVQGAASRTFVTSKAGTVTARLTNAAGPNTVVGLGVGVPFGGVAGCTLSKSVNTAAGASPQLSVPVDEGTYCVAVYDVGTIREPIDFEVIIVFP